MSDGSLFTLGHENDSRDLDTLGIEPGSQIIYEEVHNTWFNIGKTLVDEQTMNYDQQVGVWLDRRFASNLA